MPTYDYYCENNGKTVEVSHRMSEQVASWGELCERAGIDAGDTPPGQPGAQADQRWRRDQQQFPVQSGTGLLDRRLLSRRDVRARELTRRPKLAS
jgi:hypothetical protein